MEEGASATFMGTSEFSDNSIAIKQLDDVSCGDGCSSIGKGVSYVTTKGGAVHNKVHRVLVMVSYCNYIVFSVCRVH